MADRTIVLATNGRHSVRGLTVVNRQEFKAVQDEDDDLTYVVDMSSYLDGSTISSVNWITSGPRITNSSNTSTRITQRLKGFGTVEIKVTVSSGEVEEFRLSIEQRGSQYGSTQEQVPSEMPVTFQRATDPTNGDDSADGYIPGNLWLNTATLNEFRCISNSLGAARWRHIPRILATSGTAVSCAADTAENTLVTVTLTANTLGLNGSLRFETLWSFTNSANTKTLQVKLGGTAFLTASQTTNATYHDVRSLRNRTTSSQIAWAASATGGGHAASTATATTGTIDTTADTTITITGTKQSAGETLTLESYEILLTRPDIT